MHPLRRLSTTLATTALATLALLGCVAEPEGGPHPAGPRAELSLTFVSGHLGNYSNCPEEAMPLPGAAEAPEAGAARVDGDCALEGCGSLNCDAAMVIVQVENVGDAPAQALSARDVAVLMNGPLNTEILAVVDVEDSEAPGALAPGETVQLRIDFRGPPPRDGDWDVQFRVQLEVVGDADTDAETGASLETPPLSRLPAVAT